MRILGRKSQHGSQIEHGNIRQHELRDWNRLSHGEPSNVAGKMPIFNRMAAFRVGIRRAGIGCVRDFLRRDRRAKHTGELQSAMNRHRHPQG